VKNLNKRALMLLALSGALTSCATSNNTPMPTQVKPIDVAEKPAVYDKPQYEESLPEKVMMESKTTGLNAPLIYFPFNSSLINPLAMKKLEDLASDIKTNETIDNIVIEGHTDTIGSSSYNLNLGLKRADAVRDFLVFQGVEENKLDIISYGEQRPIIDTNSRERSNRRVNITVPRIDSRLSSAN